MVSSGFRATLLKLGLEEERLAVLEGKGGIVEDEFEGIRYVRFRDSARGGFRRGTVVFENGDVVPGFPHIKRIVQLENGGVRRVFKGGEPFYVEEKVDGYNVRVVKVGRRILALTRGGGFVCPFTTERILDFVDEGFFRDYPDLVLVGGEMAGPESPYIVEGPPYVEGGTSGFSSSTSRRRGGREKAFPRRSVMTSPGNTASRTLRYSGCTIVPESMT